jgi:excinuclease ABC subunit C
VRLFDRKFGVDFLAGVPREPGIYRMYDAAGGLLYVGKARNLRRRLAQYRTARRTKKDRKRRALVRSADRIAWQTCASELDASLTEIGLIQALRPRRNVAGAFPFLYPFIGIQIDGTDTRFCLTTSPQAFGVFELHGAFRSRDVTREAFFALMRLLRFVGHPTPRRPRHRLSVPRHSHLYMFRRLPRDWPDLWQSLLRGTSRLALEQLSLRLLEYDGACARSAAIHADLRAVERFFDDEASALAKAITATGYVGYPVPQRDRDALFLRYRDLARDR